MSHNDYTNNIAIVRNNYRMYAGLKNRQYDYYTENVSPAEGQEEAFKAVQSFADMFIAGQNPVGLLLVGGVGSGKTFMVSSIVNNIIDSIAFEQDEYGEYEYKVINATETTVKKGCDFWCWGRPNIPVLFASVIDLLNEFKSYFNKPDDEAVPRAMMKILQEVNLLVLDDMGAEKTSDWVQEKLFEIIDYRYNMRLPLLVTTNCTPEELKKQIGARNFDRIREMCALVPVTAKSQRPTATHNAVE